MSNHTVILHDLLQNEETKKAIEKAMSSYPLYKPQHKELYGYIPTREELNTKILNHYRFYEIGSETIARFLFNLETALNEIMPYYNQKYKAVDIMNGVEDIFGNVDVVETFEEETTHNSSNKSTENMKGSVDGKTTDKSNSSTSSKTDSTNESKNDMNTSGRNANSKTPQSQLSVKTIDNLTAASEITWNEDNNKSESSSKDKAESTGTNTGESSGTSESKTNQETKNDSTGNSSGKTKHTMTKKGNQGVSTYAHDLFEFKQLFENIEQQIINDREIVTCFMLLW